MKTLYEIVEDVKNNKKPDYEELRYALLVYAQLFNIEHRRYREVLLADEELPKKLKELKAESSFELYKSALNSPPKKYLGWNNDPENSDYQKFRQVGSKFIDKILPDKGGK